MGIAAEFKLYSFFSTRAFENIFSLRQENYNMNKVMEKTYKYLRRFQLTKLRINIQLFANIIHQGISKINMER